MDKGMVLDPALVRIEAELASPDFRAGVQEEKWRQNGFDFPFLKIEFRMTNLDGTRDWYCVRFEVAGFPAVRVAAQPWSLSRNALALNSEWPKGNERVENAFKGYPSETDPHLYCPWERISYDHNNFHQNHPEKAWRHDRRFIFILEEVHGLLNLNAVPGGSR
jgi:hypothetical protein